MSRRQVLLVGTLPAKQALYSPARKVVHGISHMKTIFHLVHPSSVITGPLQVAEWDTCLGCFTNTCTVQGRPSSGCLLLGREAEASLRVCLLLYANTGQALKDNTWVRHLYRGQFSSQGVWRVVLGGNKTKQNKNHELEIGTLGFLSQKCVTLMNCPIRAFRWLRALLLLSK